MAIATKKKSRDDIIREVETTSKVSEIERAEVVAGRRASGHPPTSVRLSAPLLERLDRIAEKEGRKRGNLIQHILWEYVHARDASQEARTAKR